MGKNEHFCAICLNQLEEFTRSYCEFDHFSIPPTWHNACKAPVGVARARGRTVKSPSTNVRHTSRRTERDRGHAQADCCFDVRRFYGTLGLTDRGLHCSGRSRNPFNHRSGRAAGRHSGFGPSRRGRDGFDRHGPHRSCGRRQAGRLSSINKRLRAGGAPELGAAATRSRPCPSSSY